MFEIKINTLPIWQLTRTAACLAWQRKRRQEIVLLYLYTLMVYVDEGFVSKAKFVWWINRRVEPIHHGLQERMVTIVNLFLVDQINIVAICCCRCWGGVHCLILFGKKIVFFCLEFLFAFSFHNVTYEANVKWSKLQKKKARCLFKKTKQKKL